MPSNMIVSALAAAVVWASVVPAAAQFSVREIGSFHIGGRQVQLSGLPVRELVFTPGAPPFRVDPNGDFEVEQMYVQYVRLASPRGRVPVLMWHGGGLTGVTWETTPDGRPGWQQRFLEAGFDVYVSDAVERGRASWARYPEVWPTEPFFRAKAEGWELFRIGPAGSYRTAPAERMAHAGQQFPTAAFDQFMKQGVPRWGTTDAAIQAAYDQLVQRVCPCIIVVHSQGGNFAFTAALRAPDKIRAIVAIEPSGAPAATADIAALRGVPHLFVFGDYLDTQALWQRIVPNIRRFQGQVAALGGTADWWDLPAMGVRGNSHMMMMDRNSDDIASRVIGWLRQRNLVE